MVGLWKQTKFAQIKSYIMCYKLTMLFFILTAFSSQSLTNNYKIIFENENASYILKIDNGSLVFKNDQPDVRVTAVSNNSADIGKVNTSGKIYKITKGKTWQEGLKIGGDDAVNGFKIGGDDVVNGFKETNLLFNVEDHHTCKIILSFEFVTIVEQSSNVKQQFPINDALFINIKGNKFSLFK